MVETIYTRVKALDLSVDELRRCNLSNTYLYALWVSYLSKSNREHLAVHVPNGPPTPYILLSGKDKNEKDFRDVENIVVDITDGKPYGKIMDRGSDICDHIDFKERLTLKKILGFIERYEQEFTQVKIPRLYLGDMFQFDYELSCLPREKLSFDGSYLNYPRFEFGG